MSKKSKSSSYLLILVILIGIGYYYKDDLFGTSKKGIPDGIYVRTDQKDYSNKKTKIGAALAKAFDVAKAQGLLAKQIEVRDGYIISPTVGNDRRLLIHENDQESGQYIELGGIGNVMISYSTSSEVMSLSILNEPYTYKRK